MVDNESNCVQEKTSKDTENYVDREICPNVSIHFVKHCGGANFLLQL